MEDSTAVALLTAHIGELRKAAEEEVANLDEALTEERREKEAALDEASTICRASAREYATLTHACATPP